MILQMENPQLSGPDSSDAPTLVLPPHYTFTNLTSHIMTYSARHQQESMSSSSEDSKLTHHGVASQQIGDALSTTSRTSQNVSPEDKQG